MTALLVGTVLALGALAFVLVPLFRAPPAGAPETSVQPLATPEDASSPSDTAIVALREVEFDRATGKLSDEDYQALKTKYTAEALAALRTEEAQPGGVSDAELEAMIRSHRPDVRHCPECGARPEPDALYCSGCGRVLPGHCAHCGAPVNEPDARFCASCGTGLAA